jgi:hypothetical protein
MVTSRTTPPGPPLLRGGKRAGWRTGLAAVIAIISFYAGAGEAVDAPASDEAELIMKKFKIPAGMKVDLFAAEPMLAHPVALCTDEKGRIYVAETFRFADGIAGGGDRDFGDMDFARAHGLARPGSWIEDG